MDKPYSRWFWRDFEQDLKLSACHPFAQAIWMRMLAIMSQGEPYGHLRMEPRTALARVDGGAPGGAGGVPRGIAGGVPGGVPRGLHDGIPGGVLQDRYTLPKSGSLEHLISSRCGVTPEQLAWSIAHLEEHGVFSRDEHGIIYCRRMVREDQDHTQRVQRARKAYEKRERIRVKEPPQDPARKAPPRSGKTVESTVKTGTPDAPAGGTPPGIPRGGAGGVPGGPPIPITIDTKTTPPPPPSREGGSNSNGAEPRKPTRHERTVARAVAVARGSL
jgi:hypothetical protein